MGEAGEEGKRRAIGARLLAMAVEVSQGKARARSYDLKPAVLNMRLCPFDSP